MYLYNELVQDYLNQNKKTFIIFIIITCLTFPLESIVIPELYGRLYLGIGNQTTTTQKTFKKIAMIILLIIGIWMVIQIFYYIKNWLLGKILPTYLEFTTKKLFRKIIDNYESNYQDIRVSKNIARLFELSRDLKDLFYYFTATFLPLILTVIVVNIYFFFADWKIGLASTTSIAILFIVSIFFGKKIVEVSAEREEKYFKMNEKVHDSFDNLMNIYLNNEKETELKKADLVHQEHTKYYMKQLDYVNYMSLFTSVMCVIIFALVIGIAFFNLKKGSFTSKQFITISLIVVYFLGFLINITTWTPEELMRLGILKHSKQFIMDILAKKDDNYIENPDLKKGNIEFRDVGYQYGSGKAYIFKDLSFVIKRGGKFGVVGSSGSGKTTIMKLLLGLHPVTEGEILINGMNIRKIRPSELRDEINYINQRTNLFNGTVLENMQYGNGVSDEKIIEILKKYDLLQNFNQLKNNVRSDVGVQGKGVSGGMQKIIINVRGILKGGSIIIFDEPLSGLDANTRKKMIQLIKDLTQDKTLIIITHDKEILSITQDVIDLDDIRKRMMRENRMMGAES